MKYASTTPVYVHTPAGVVKVEAGERVPQDALPSAIDRLVRFGAVVASPDPADEVEGVHDPEPAAKSTRRSRARKDTPRDDAG